MMKKLVTLALALAMACALSVTAFAANSIINQGSADQTGKTTVTYQVSPAYTVTIPEKVTLDGASVTVKAENVKVAKGKAVAVKLTATSGTDNAFTVQTTEGASLAYTVKDASDNVISLNNTVLTVNPDSTTADAAASGSASLTFALADSAVVQYAGEYKGTVTFTVSVDPVTTP